MAEGPETDLKKTALHERHLGADGRMVGFAGYALPVHYGSIVAEHGWTRDRASLFDVSHMGQVKVSGPDHATTVKGLERLTPADLQSLVPGQMRYTVLLNERGGIEDDLIVTRPPEGAEEDGVMYLVVNAGRKLHDTDYMQHALGDDIRFELRNDRALLALQGPKADEVLAAHSDAPHRLGFMQARQASIGGIEVLVSRSGYTGEDGFEIAAANTDAVALFDLLVAEEAVRPAGLGARDSLRLEAGLCLYGQDIDEGTDPVTAALGFSIGRRRRAEGGFIGAGPVLEKLRKGGEEVRVGLRFAGRQPVRAGAELVDGAGYVIGRVTSGGFSPTLSAPIAMGYLPADAAAIGTEVTAMVRGRPVEGAVAALPFVPHRYRRSPQSL